jgi:hypothetical protein
MDLEQQKAEYQAKRKERLAQAVEWAKRDGAVYLLYRNGFVVEARVLCRMWARDNLWDCGTSCGWEEVYTEMLNAIRRKVCEIV